MMVKLYDGTLEYILHNLYGLSEFIVTNKAMTIACNKQPFALSHSTFIIFDYTLQIEQEIMKLVSKILLILL